MSQEKEKNGIKYLGYKSEFLPPPPLPFGRGKYIMMDGDRIDNKGTILSTTFTVAIVKDGVEGTPFEYTEKY